MRQSEDEEVRRRKVRLTDKDLPKHWKDAQNHFLHGNKALHPVNPAAGKSQHGESEKREKKRDIIQ